jgi:hypothetical protein
MIILMTAARRRQLRYDHRLRDLVQRTGDVTVATDLGIPHSTARGWLGKAPQAVVSLDMADLSIGPSSRSPARSPSSRSGSARSGHPPRPGTA